jgi:hypothetical protein
MDDLTDADTTTVAPQLDDVLTWDGNNWVPAAPTGGGGGAAALDDLSDVTITTPVDGDILLRQSGAFINIALTSIDIDWTQLTNVPSTFSPTAHAASHGNGGGDEISIDWSQITSGVPSSFTPSAHTHSWADITTGTPPALDTLSAPTDVTTLNATDQAHGLLPKLSGDANQFLSGAGTWATPAGGEGGGSTSLAGLTDDVGIVSPANGDILVFNSTSGDWENEAQSVLSIAWSQITGEPSTFTPSTHASSHGNGGGDEISIDWSQITTGKPSTFAPSAHASSHADGGTDEISIAWGQITSGIPSSFTPTAHKTSHQNGGADELLIDWTQLDNVPSTFTPSSHSHTANDITSGQFTNADIADLAYSKLTGVPSTFTPSAHASSHGNGGSDEITIDWSQITGEPSTYAPSAHATSHADGGSDEVNITTLGGFSGNSTDVLKGDGTWAAESGGGGTPDPHAASHANGGSDEISIDWSQITTGVPSTFTPSSHNHAATEITSGTLAVGRGGTGRTTFTQHALLKGGASNAYDLITVGSNDDVLAVVSGTPAWKTPDSETVGKALGDGDGVTTEYIIPHGVSGVDSNSYCFVDVASHAYNRTWEIDGTNITINLSAAPENGTNNVIIYWRIIP